MSCKVFNGCMIAGVALISAGVALVHIPSALIVAGVLVLGLTFAAIRVSG